MGKKSGVKKIKRLQKGIKKFLSENHCQLPRAERWLLLLVIELLERFIKKEKRKRKISFFLILLVIKSTAKKVAEMIICKLFNF